MQRFLLLLLCFLPGLVAAQAPQQPVELGVYDAIRLAEEYSPVLNQIREELKARSGERRMSYGIQSPELTYFREGIPDGASGGYAEQRWALSQSIDFPLQTYYRLKQLDTEQDAALLHLDAATHAVKAQIKRAYTDLLYGQEILHLREQEVRLSEELLEAVETRVKVGESSGLDQIKAEIQLSESLSNLEDARRQFQNARYSLFHAAGLDPENQVYEIVFPDTLAYFDVSINQDEVMERLRDRAELKSSERRLDAARWGTREAWAGLLPDIKIDYYPQDYGSGFNNHGFQIGVSVPIWFMLNHQGNMRVARARLQDRYWQQQAVELDLKKEIEQAWHSYETSRETIQRYHNEVLGRSAELLQLTREGYRIGELDLLTLLDTQRTYLASQKRYYDALRDYYFHLIDLERSLDRDIVFNQDQVNAYRSISD